MNTKQGGVAHTYISRDCGYVSQTRFDTACSSESNETKQKAYINAIKKLLIIKNLKHDKLAVSKLCLSDTLQLEIVEGGKRICLDLKALDRCETSDGGGSYNNAINEAKLLQVGIKKGTVNKDLCGKVQLPIICTLKNKAKIEAKHKDLSCLTLSISEGNPRKAFILSNAYCETPDYRYINIHNRDARTDISWSFHANSDDLVVVNNMPLGTDMSFVDKRCSFRIGSNQILDYVLNKNMSIKKALKKARRVYLNLEEVTVMLKDSHSHEILEKKILLKTFADTYNIQELVVTDGEHGCMTMLNGAFQQVSIPKQSKWRAKALLGDYFYESGDPTGCGDCLAPCMDYYESLYPKDSLEKALRFGVFMASSILFFTKASNFLNLDDTIFETVYDTAIDYAQS